MKNTAILIALLATVLVLGGLSAYLLRVQGGLNDEIAVQAAAQAEAQATLVQVFEERRAAEATVAADLSRQAEELAALETALNELIPAATAAARPAATAAPMNPPPDQGSDAPPQVRIILRERESVWPVGEPLDIIASAAHPIGIAVLNISVNGETLLADSPFDPRMNIVATRWTPTEPGEYTIAAVATTIRGRASAPVTIELLVVDESDPEAVTSSILRRIERNVEELRGLSQLQPVTVELISPGELQESIRGDLLVDYTRADAEREVQVLSMFDFLPDDFPLYDNVIETFGQAIAGYYDSEADTMFVVLRSEELDEETRLTHAHEYMHALQDQHFSLSLLEDESLSKDQRLALRSLGEGEAELLEFLFQSRGYLTGEQGADSNPVFPTPPASDVPDFLLSDFTFPYVRGFAFVSRFFEESGFAGVDELWEKIPQSSEQIIHPDRYEAGDQPQPVDLPDLAPALGDGWQLLESNVFGEFYLREYLGQWLDEETVAAAATGWGGDRYAVYREASGRRLMVLHLRWDSPADQDEFSAAYKDWGDSRHGAAAAESEPDGRCWADVDGRLCHLSTPAGTFIIRSDQNELVETILDYILNLNQ